MGICISCSKEILPGYQSKSPLFCRLCYVKYEIGPRRAKRIDTIRRERRNHNLKYRLMALLHYGGNPPKCSCCGEERLEFLAIDHKNKNGAQHRREMKFMITTWLRHNGYPEGFRVLCHNCNLAIGFYGVCPHESKIQQVPDGLWTKIQKEVYKAIEQNRLRSNINCEKLGNP